MPDIDLSKPFADMSEDELKTLADGADEGEKTSADGDTPDEDKGADEAGDPTSDDADDKAPTELEQLQTRVEAYEKDKETVADLRRSVGRLQSELEKLGNVEQLTDADVDRKVKTELGSTQDLLADLVRGMDDTVIDPSLRAKINQTIEDAKVAAARDSLTRDVEETVRATIKESLPEVQETPARSTLETAIVEEIRGYGLDDTTFDWSEASTILNSDGEAALRKYFRGQIVERLAEDSADQRRQARKDDSKSSPDPSGQPRTDLDKLGDKNTPLDDAVAILRKMKAL